MNAELAVDLLLSEWHRFDIVFLPFVLMNLAQIPNPRAQTKVLELIESGEELPNNADPVTWVRHLAHSGVPETCDKLLQLYEGDRLLPSCGETPDVWPYVTPSIAVACRHAGDRERALRICLSLRSTDDNSTRYRLVITIEERGFFQLYADLFAYFENSSQGTVRGRAAIALSRLKLLPSRDEIVRKMPYAEKDVELPFLSDALSYFDDPRAIPGLIHGLQHSFQASEEAMHEQYAAALDRLTSREAREARMKWFKRI